MKRNFIRKALFSLCMIAAILAVLISIHNNASAFSPHDRITSTLSGLGVKDAELVNQTDAPALSDAGCLLYTSDSTQMGYYFNPDTGVLTDMFSYDILDRTYREKASAAPALAPMQASAGNLDADLIEYAGICIGEDLFGTLQLRTDQDQGELHQYTVFEVYDGIETGTSVMFSCTAEGQISMCNVAIGSIFEPAEDGTYVLAGGSELIGEEAAVEIARAGLTAMMNPAQISDHAACKLDAAEDMLIYTVRIEFTDENGSTREYLAGVNAHTGELWREGISK